MARDILAEREELDRASEGRTICSDLAATVEQHGGQDAFRIRRADGTYDAITWAEFRDRVRDAALGLASIGVQPGDFVLIQARCTPEHSIADMGVVHARATPVSLYNTLAPEQIAYVANHCGARMAIVEDVGFLEQFLKVRGEMPSLEKIVLIRGAGEAETDWVVSWDEVTASGAAESERDRDAFDRMWEQVTPDDIATLIYTSGTTGPPKAVIDMHRTLLWHWEMVRRMYDFRSDDTGLSYLPLAHAAGRLSGHYQPISYGGTVTCVPDFNEMLVALLETRPTLFLGVPRVYEKLYAGINAALAAQPDENLRTLVQGAIGVAREVLAHEMKGAEVPADLREKHDRAKPILKAVLSRVGLDNVRWAMVGAAPISTEVLEFFTALGIPLFEVWGMSELTAVATGNQRGKVKVGSVGPAALGVEVTIADDGEILARGGNLMAGYYKDPGKTAEAIDADGWMHTGDIGTVDEDGYFTIVDRKKELIITAGGKNISPANIENLLKQHPLIGQACVIGDRRAYLTALIVLDPEVAPAWASSKGIEAATVASLASHPDVVAEVHAAVDTANEQISRVENVRRFTILPAEWTAESDELTPTLKLKRRVILDKYAEDIDAMYA
jgi:long-chain acyl-CoA synthetase